MYRLLIAAILAFLATGQLSAQNQEKEKVSATIDSTALLQELMELLDSADKPTSYGLVSIGASNRLFSVHNNQLNSKQSTTSSVVLNPTIGYFDKSGFSVAAGASLMQEPKKKFGPNQYSITVGYDLPGNDNWSAGISYSRYIITDKYSAYSSPVQNDVYAYGTYKKKWLEPGLALGFSGGKFTQIFKGKTPAGAALVDTGTYHLRSLSLMASVSHTFEWYEVFSKKDGISFTPSLQLNMGADSTQTLSHTIAPVWIRLLKKIGRLQRLQGKNSFQAQSVGLNLEANYSIGSFSVMPQLYLDYYLPATEEKRFTQVFALAVGYSF